ncbi:MAG: NADH-quinone oxidoreductase subunit NuoE [Gammaproteobacteria bacterium]
MSSPHPPPALSAQEIEAIQAAAAHYEDASAVAIEALLIVQRYRGWVSDTALAATADLLRMSPAQLDAVATFYNLIYRRPVGKRVIHYCNSVTCWMLGADDIREHFCRRLGIRPGETTSDGEYTLLPNVCLGACDHAPVVMVGDETFLDVDADGIDTILRSDTTHG